jgi:hypothetical protein
MLNEMKEVWIFFGRDWWCGFTPIQDGSNLPADKGPWKPHSATWWLSRKYAVEHIATDIEILDGIERNGYYLHQATPSEIEQIVRGPP